MTDVTVVIPVYNAEKWIDECLQSVLIQDFQGKIEVSLYNDGSTDSTLQLLEVWKTKLEEKNISLIIKGHKGQPKGVGFAKNRAVDNSHGDYLCFLDADDVMTSDRVSRQFQAAKSNQNAIVGSCFHREPVNSTGRFTQWANRLTPDQLYTQIFTSHGPTVIMPTWFCSRDIYYNVGGFDEGGKGVPEDLIFFYKHLELGGSLLKMEADLLMYRYHQQGTTFSIHEDTIWKIRLEYLQKQILTKWPTFTIWNAGKQGRKFYRSLSRENQCKVTMFCDVDDKKIEKGYYIYEESQENLKPRIPIVHFRQANPPFIICVKLDLTGGVFEKNLESLNLTEGKDYFHFN